MNDFSVWSLIASENLEWAFPWFFVFILFLPILFLWQRHLTLRNFFSFPSFAALKSENKKKLSAAAFFPLLRYLALIFLIAALARPQLVGKEGRRESEGLDILLTLDTSGSMQEDDMEMNGLNTSRMEAVKYVAEAFIKKRKDDRIGTVVFGSWAFLQAPLTLDHEVLLSFLKDVRVQMAGKETALGDAIGTSVSHLKDIKSKNKIVILLTDGVHSGGRLDPTEAMAIAADFGVRIYTIGFGGFGGSGGFGGGLRGLFQMGSSLDEDLLRKIAQKTGGQYFRARTVADLQQVFDNIDQLEKTVKEAVDHREREEVYHGFLLWALLLLSIETCLRATSWWRLPA